MRREFHVRFCEGGGVRFPSATRLVIGFRRKDDAEQVLEWLTARLAEYGLTLHPQKTRILPFGRPGCSEGGGKGPGAFDFLGFTVHWRRGRRGRWALGMKTRKASFRKAIVAIGEWCRRHRHRPLKEQHAALTRRLRGHYNYFGVNGNSHSLDRLLERAKRVWLKWLRRRSQRGDRLRWKRFAYYLEAHPLPTPRIGVQIWGVVP